jgi:aspartyl-tRNA(Asn)/glutamyl-tRNA(Gln) amidotransferase subunit C
MQIDLAQLRHVATLAKLDINDDDEARMCGELSAILDLVDALRAAPDAPPTTSVPAPPLRADVAEPVTTRDAALAQAASSADGFYLVPKVIE